MLAEKWMTEGVNDCIHVPIQRQVTMKSNKKVVLVTFVKSQGAGDGTIQN
jgi:hypothetical protein